jgi:hypothetical protein
MPFLLSARMHENTPDTRSHPECRFYCGYSPQTGSYTIASRYVRPLAKLYYAWKLIHGMSRLTTGRLAGCRAFRGVCRSTRHNTHESQRQSSPRPPLSSLSHLAISSTALRETSNPHPRALTTPARRYHMLEPQWVGGCLCLGVRCSAAVAWQVEQMKHFGPCRVAFPLGPWAWAVASVPSI